MQTKQVKIRAYIQPKNRRLYAFITYYLCGVRQIKWRALGLTDSADQQTAKSKLKEVVEKFKEELQEELIGDNKYQLKNTSDTTPNVLNANDAAEYMMVNVKTLYKMIKDGRLPCVKVGGKYRIPKKAVEDLLVTYKHYYNSHRTNNSINKNGRDVR
jgi:excisionase family DNA binding protein